MLVLALAACDPGTSTSPAIDAPSAARSPSPTTTYQEWPYQCSDDGRFCFTLKVWNTGTTVKMHLWNRSGSAGGYRGSVITEVALTRVPATVYLPLAGVSLQTGPRYSTTLPAVWRSTDRAASDDGRIAVGRVVQSDPRAHGVASNCGALGSNLFARTPLWINRSCGFAYATGGSSTYNYPVEMQFRVDEPFNATAIGIEVTAVDESGNVSKAYY